MPQTPNIPNRDAAFGLYTGANDPTLQYDYPSSEQGVYNLFSETQGKPGTLSRFRTNWNRPGPLKILCAGDSITQGIGSGGATTPYSQYLAQILRNMWGLSDGGLGLMLPFWSGIANSGVTNTGSPVAGAPGFGISSTARVINGVDTYTFNTANASWVTGTKNVQTIDVLYYDIGAAGGDIQYKIDGGAVQTLVTAKLNDHVVKSVRIPAGVGPVGLSDATHSVQILGNGGFGVSFVAIVCYSGTAGASGLMVHNAGCGGTTIQAATATSTTGESALSYINWLQPNLTILHDGVNDTLQGVQSISGYDAIQTNISTFMFLCIFLGGDVILVSPPPLADAFSSIFPQKYAKNPDVERAMQVNAAFYNTPLLSLRTCWGDWGTYFNSGLCGDSTIHPNDAGYKDFANRLYRIMMSA